MSFDKAAMSLDRGTMSHDKGFLLFNKATIYLNIEALLSINVALLNNNVALLNNNVASLSINVAYTRYIEREMMDSRVLWCGCFSLTLTLSWREKEPDKLAGNCKCEGINKSRVSPLKVAATAKCARFLLSPGEG